MKTFYFMPVFFQNRISNLVLNLYRVYQRINKWKYEANSGIQNRTPKRSIGKSIGERLRKTSQDERRAIDMMKLRVMNLRD